MEKGIAWVDDVKESFARLGLKNTEENKASVAHALEEAETSFFPDLRRWAIGAVEMVGIRAPTIICALVKVTCENPECYFCES